MAQLQTDTELPNPFSLEDLARMEEAQRQLGMVKQLIERCKRCRVPVEMAEKDCADMCAFFDAIIGEFRGPQSPTDVNPQGRR